MIEGRYEDTDAAAEYTGERVLDYIRSGNATGVPLEFRGLKVFGVVGMLRTHEDELFGEQSDRLLQEQLVRRDEIVGEVQQALDMKLHYYPFGHIQNHGYEGRNRDRGNLHGDLTSWGSQANSSRKRRGHHGGEFTLS